MPESLSNAVWLLPIIAGVADAGLRNIIKFTAVRHFTLVAGGYFFALPYYAVWLAITGMPEVQSSFWVVVGVEVPLLTLAQILTVEAHRRSDLIRTVPLHAITPALLLITAPLMGGGWPTAWGILGIIVLTGGLYVLNTREKQAGLLDPFRQLLSQRGLQLMLIVIGIFSITSNLDYLAWKRSNEPFFLLVMHGACGLLSALLAAMFYRCGHLTLAEVNPAGSFPVLIPYGAVMALSVMPHMLAFKWIPVVPYVIAGKRTGAVLFGVGIGLAVSLVGRFSDRHKGEWEDLQYRIPGIFLMLAGMFLIVVLGK